MSLFVSQKLVGYETINYVQSSVLVNKPCRQRQHIGIVVLPCQTCYLCTPTQGTTNVRIFVNSHLHSVSRAAYHYAALHFAIVDSLAYFMSKIRVINTFLTPCTTVIYLKTILL